MTVSIQRVSFIGLGKLGAPIAAAVAAKGIPVVGVDLNPVTVRLVNEGRAPVPETGLPELMAEARPHLRATHDYGDAVRNSDATFIIVPTPSEAHGGFSTKWVLEACRSLGDALRQKRGYHLVVLTSTVLPGATEAQVKPVLEQHSGKRCGPDFGLCYSPEFVALGSVIRDFRNPDFLLIGESDARAGDLFEQFALRVVDNRPGVAHMNFVNAELAKLAVNTYVTTKISFSNMVARLCERLPGADVDTITGALGMDARIGGKYLKGGIGYGGPCFPRDNLALTHLADSLGVPAPIAQSTDRFNRSLPAWLAELVKGRLAAGGAVAVLGLSYKPRSEIVEESQGLQLAQALAADGVEVVVYDPMAMAGAERVLGKTVQYARDSAEAVRQARVVVLATPWEEFRQLPEEALRVGPRRTVVDCWRALDEGQRALVDWVPLGRTLP